MTSYIIKVNGRRVDEVVFMNSKSIKQVIDAMVKEGYDRKTLTVKKSCM